jgi:hypothetical protein
MHNLLRQTIQNRLRDMEASGCYPPSHPDRALLSEALMALGGPTYVSAPVIAARRRLNAIAHGYLIDRDFGDETPAH